MNHYHIYEAIGRGKYSYFVDCVQREKKKTIEYFAIKSVDKSHKNKVLHEVRVLHSLDHSNVLRFYSWYETSAHLWLVLEYCVGGDLMNLLRQDGQLPEDSIHDLAHGLVTALQFLHSKGIIYCDLKPSNILLDENGQTKLCDFGLARKLVDISKTPSSMLPQAKRGTPSYMAPELFEDGGVHSYASDLWALGCVLYECYTGRPPFIGREFTQLVKSIISDSTPPLPGTPSRSFVNLISSLLVKDPAQRIHWRDLCGHTFWRSKIVPVQLPPEPAFDNMLELYAKPCLLEHNGDRSNKTPTKYREKNTKDALKQVENSMLGSKGHETPIRRTPVGCKAQTKVSARGVQEKQSHSSHTNKRVNLLRLSRIAKTNLQRENEKENYRRPIPNNAENNAEIHIENTDMELDFDENNEDEVHDEEEGSDNPTCTPEQKTLIPNPCQINVEDTDSNTRLETLPLTNMLDSGSRTCSEEPSSERAEVPATPPSVSPHLRTQRAREGNALDNDTPKSSGNLSEVFWHLSDLSVRPVMPSRKANTLEEVIPSLPFEALKASDFVKMSKEQMNGLDNKIIVYLTGSSSNVVEKQNIIRYLEMLSSKADAANILTNGPIMLMLVKMLRLSKASALRVQLASLIGLLIRHSTSIDDALANSGVLGSLTDGLRDKQEKVRRFSMAALGELLFYISTQNEQNKDPPPQSPSKESRPSSGWQVPSSTLSLVSSVLQKGQDDMTQLYALRTIENVCSQGGYWAARFTSQDVISNLCYIYRAAGKQESIRLTAGSCLVRLVRFNPPSIQFVIERLPLKDIASTLVKGSSREQQICLNLLNMAMLASHLFTNIGRQHLSLVEDKNLVPCLVSLIEQGTEILRGKTLTFVAFLCKNGRRWLPHFFCNTKLLSVVDRLVKEKDTYVQQCLDAFVHVVASIVPSLLDTMIGDVKQMIAGRRHGQSGLTSRTPLKGNVHLLPVILYLLGSSSFKNRVITHQVLQQLADLMKVVEATFQGRDDFQITLLRVLECVAEESSLVLQNPDIFIHEILPSLTVLYKGNKDGNARFLCLKILFEAMIIFLTEPFDKEKRYEDLKSISNSHFLPLYPILIEDEDPIPVYAQKLLVMLIEFGFIKICDIVHQKTVSQCFELLGDLSSANVNNVKLCLALASAPEIDSKLLSQLKVVRKIGNLLEFVYAKDMEDFIEPTLGLCKAFLLHSVCNRKGFSYSKEPALLGDGSSEVRNACDQPQCLRDIIDFGSNVAVFLELIRSREVNIADTASECVVLLLKAAPREAITGFLTNLPKVTAILNSCQNSIPHLILLRVLHALGYSCQQYISHAMILSISIPEILKIEGIVSEMKKSKLQGVSSVAMLVASELQRLPHCI